MRFGLKAIVGLGGAVLTLAPALVAGTMFTDAVTRRAETVNAVRLRTIGELASDQLSRTMHQLRRDVDGMARNARIDDPEGMRRQFSYLAQLDTRYSWVGAADVEGKVVAASQGLLEGHSVAERPWFRRGLIEPTATDVHDAELLSKLLPSTPEPRRFIDFSVPLRNPEGSVVGVLGAHFDWNWVRENLGASAPPGMDVLLVSRDRNVLFGPKDLEGRTLSVGSAIAAGQSVTVSLDERWPDGQDYITVVVPQPQHRDMPSFGWSLIVRTHADTALEPTRAIIRSFWTILGGGVIVAIGLFWFFAGWLATPLRRIVRSAEGLAAGDVSEPPHPETRYDEAARLSAALVRLQTREMRPYQKVSKPPRQQQDA